MPVLSLIGAVVADFSKPGEPPVKSLAAVTSTGAGTAVDFRVPARTVTIQTVVTGSPASVSCTLQGSNDGATWVTVATSTSTTGDAQYSVDKPFRFFRANLGTLTGGTAPTVTAWVAGV